MTAISPAYKKDSETITFEHKAVTNVYVVSTGNVVLGSTGVGSSINGRVLVNGDIILLKDQTDQSENGVYETITAQTFDTTRHSDYDTFEELNGAVVRSNDNLELSGTQANQGTVWYQTSVLTSLSDNQVWSQTPATQSLVIPDGITNIIAKGFGSGGGGGGGDNGQGGGGGGAGGIVSTKSLTVTPGETLTITLGKHGTPGLGDRFNFTRAGTSGGNGGDFIISGVNGEIRFFGGGGGGMGGAVGGNSFYASGGSTASTAGGGGASLGNGGNAGSGVGVRGGGGAGGAVTASGGAGSTSEYNASTPAVGGFGTGGIGGGGGGGGSSLLLGGDGGAGSSVAGSPGLDAPSNGGGGGGGGGASSATGNNGRHGGLGAGGSVTITY